MQRTQDEQGSTTNHKGDFESFNYENQSPKGGAFKALMIKDQGEHCTKVYKKNNKESHFVQQCDLK